MKSLILALLTASAPAFAASSACVVYMDNSGTNVSVQQSCDGAALSISSHERHHRRNVESHSILHGQRLHILGLHRRLQSGPTEHRGHGVLTLHIHQKVSGRAPQFGAIHTLSTF